MLRARSEHLIVRAGEFLYGVTAFAGPVDRASESAKTGIRPVASAASGGINFVRLKWNRRNHARKPSLCGEKDFDSVSAVWACRA
jgi:hypothetical protein